MGSGPRETNEFLLPSIVCKVPFCDSQQSHLLLLLLLILASSFCVSVADDTKQTESLNRTLRSLSSSVPFPYLDRRSSARLPVSATLSALAVAVLLRAMAPTPRAALTVLARPGATPISRRCSRRAASKRLIRPNLLMNESISRSAFWVGRRKS